MKILENIEKINTNAGLIGAWLIIPLNAVVVYEVVIRYVFNNPTGWVYDTAWMLYSAMFLFGGAYTLIKRRHVRIDILFSIFPKKVQIWYDIFFFAIVLVPILGVLTIKGVDFAAKAWATGETLSTTLWNFPAGPPKTLIPIGFGLLFLQGLVELTRDLKMALGKGNDNGS